VSRWLPTRIMQSMVTTNLWEIGNTWTHWVGKCKDTSFKAGVI